MTDLRRFRRRREFQSGGEKLLGQVGFVFALLLVIGIGTAGLLVAVSYADLTSNLPPAEDLELIFGSAGRESFRPVRFYDRTGDKLLLEVLHPQAQSRRWLYLDPAGPIDLPEHALEATIAIQDETFWSNPGYNPQEAIQALLSYLELQQPQEITPSIGQQLVQSQLLPLGGGVRSPEKQSLQSMILAAEVTQEYPKGKILEWYINSADYGNHAYGIDAAALVYFAKHASELTLPESAMLASIPLDPSLNPVEAPEEAKKQQAETLRAMVRMGAITQYEAKLALAQILEIKQEVVEAPDHLHALVDYLQVEVLAMFGEDALRRSGLRIQTTVDYDLQLQSHCTLKTHIARLSGLEPNVILPAADGTGCLAAGFLPPVRPRDANLDHNIESGGFVVLDATKGEILALAGPITETRSAGTTFSPFVYLTAFAQGYSPGSMVLDLPPDGELTKGTSEEQASQYNGPVRIRTALANGYIAANDRVQSLMGVDSVERTARSMGVSSATFNTNPNRASGDLDWEASLLDITGAFAVLANQGTMVGEESPSDSAARYSLQPSIISTIEDGARRSAYSFEPEQKAVLSAQLAYLMTNVLTDETARWSALGQSNTLEIGRPAGAIASVAGGRDFWSLGYTPSRVVGVWLGNLTGAEPVGLHEMNSAAPVWHALARYATKDLPTAGWPIPPGVNRIDVCDPSGLLPTEYCPSVVSEFFLSGTEPITFDNLYQPYLVNQETGKLATLNTPIDLVEERIYLVPPPEAAEWAQMIGLEKPPQEYDTLTDLEHQDPDVRITTPAPFSYLRDAVVVRGYANPVNFDYYRLQYGGGLNPTRWVQIGDDSSKQVRGGTLVRWKTDGLNGLYTLQLVVVDDDGHISTHAIHVTVDNQPPEIEILLPEPDQVLRGTSTQEMVIEVEVSDNFGVERVEFYVDGRKVETVTAPPYSIRWRMVTAGEHEVYVQAIDFAGNVVESDSVAFYIERP
ncbi:MAG: transglycosylase domain-containing protein [Anaerolineales bacterium]|nr:transglycosylase domain-containing protein [Anaerolineales bacterium]